MKYRFRPSKKTILPAQVKKASRKYRLKGYDKPRHSISQNETIELSSLFDLAKLSSAKKQRVKKIKRPLKIGSLKNYFKKLKNSFASILEKVSLLKAKITYLSQEVISKLPVRKKHKSISALPVLSGALCAAILVSFLATGSVLLTLFMPYGRSFVEITIPDLIGKEHQNISLGDSSHINLIINYEPSPDVSSGIVISQTPSPGVTRRIYSDSDYFNINLTVSSGNETYILDDLTGMSLRDASLILKNHGLLCSVREVYSENVPKGEVIETYPSADTRIYEGATVVLQISAGKQILRVAVPNLIGATESEAASLLRSAGLVTGNVTYRASSFALGTVIWQEISPYSYADDGSSVSYTVSAGEKYSAKTVPDLYGMNLPSAIAKLKEYGLTLGNTYYSSNAAPSGTVVAQSPSAQTPITSSTVSVDLFISS